MACTLVLYFAFVLCAWVVIGPYHIKFRTLFSTLDCLFSIINGDDMYVTFAAVEPTATEDVVVFHKIFMYAFIVIFIYFVLNLFLTIILEAYEEMSDDEVTENSPLWLFIDACTIPTDSPLFLQDFKRPDRNILLTN
ncbi:Mucolipin-2, partial [Cichlidogyrus casuarinus]